MRVDCADVLVRGCARGVFEVDGRLLRWVVQIGVVAAFQFTCSLSGKRFSHWSASLARPALSYLFAITPREHLLSLSQVVLRSLCVWGAAPLCLLLR
jgi:hypothetical protein